MPAAPPRHRVAGPVAQPRQQYDQWRGSAASRGYDRRWQKCRRAFLAAYPLCLFCYEQGRLTPANEVDHILTIKERPDLRLDWSNLRPLCKPCHSARTARDQRGSPAG